MEKRICLHGLEYASEYRYEDMLSGNTGSGFGG
jgi:hypothetical protein